MEQHNGAHQIFNQSVVVPPSAHAGFQQGNSLLVKTPQAIFLDTWPPAACQLTLHIQILLLTADS